MDYGLVDADNHYYESEDCFTRFGDEEIARFVTWYSQGRRGLWHSVRPPDDGAEPDVQSVTKPGIMHKRLRELAEGGERKNLDSNDRLRWGGRLSRCPSTTRTGTPASCHGRAGRGQGVVVFQHSP